jgi:two-component system LytT family response regulator
MLRVLLVDDEQPARERLRGMLDEIAEVEVLREAADGEEAMERIQELKPDLVFLDIQMPACTGMEVAASLPAPRPKIVFCTAYEEYAVEAFELHAVDYLLKPINRSRLMKAIQRVKQLAGHGYEESIDRASQADEGSPERFLAKLGNRYKVIPRKDVQYFASEGGLTKLLTAKRHYWMQPTLNDLEKRLDACRFLRVSRAAIVNLDAVREVVPLASGGGEVSLTGGARIEVSRRRYRSLLENLSR